MTQATEYDARADAYAQQRQQVADMERTAEHLFYRGNTMLRAITEDMITLNTREAVTRSNVARACFEGAAYAKREAAALRNALPTE